MDENKLAIFHGQAIRRVLQNGQWWFSITDIIQVLTDSVNACDYWFKMKIRVKSDDGIELSTISRQLVW